MSKSLKVGAALSGALLLVLGGCGQSPPPQAQPKPPSQASQDWARLTAGFINDYFVAQPFFAAQSGKHEYDGQLADLSEHGIKREIARLKDGRTQIEAVDPKTLEPREQFDREYLLSVIDRDLFWMDTMSWPFKDPAWYTDRIDPDMYLNRNYAPLDVRLKAYIKYARGIPKMAENIKANLKGPLPKTYVELAIAQYGGLAEHYGKNVAPVFASVSDPGLQKDLSDADTAAAAAMNDLQDAMIALRKTANDNFAIGADAYAKMLSQTERVTTPIDQIEAAGRADLERNTAALKAECDTYLPKGSLQQCIAKMESNKPKEGMVEWARQQLPMLKDFVVKNNIVSVPSNDEALVMEAPPYNRSNAAFIQVPGPYDHGVASVFNIAPPDPKWSKAEQAQYIRGQAVLLFTAVHEVWPGHFLQFLHSNSNPDKLEGIWVGYAFAEGWAHYAEEMMVEEGLAQGDPERHIGQLTDALLRDVRLLSSIGLHTHAMTVAQSEKMFREQAFQDPGNARQQAARGTYDPGYLNYTLGKLMIRKLRADWIAKQGGASGSGGSSNEVGGKPMWHDFHDKFLSFGGPPIPLVRKQMMGDESSAL
jgi:uncharacterized protein (DUF885 family)